MKFVIDTNVAIVASGRNTHASEQCQDTCKELLGECKELDIVIDELGLILDEYANKLNPSGKPTIGDAFFKYLKNYQYSSNKIHRVPITPLDEENTEFAELKALNANLKDLSDRKFLAVAVISQAIIVNATDSDWTKEKVLLDSLAIQVKQLCPEHSCK